jgi:hypothetical protein
METALVGMRVEDREKAIRQEKEDMMNAEKAGLITIKPEKQLQRC